MARSICLYGPTKRFKTAQAKFFARYIAEVTGKATLLMSADGGGWTPCEPEIAAGMIVPYRIDASTIPLPVIHQIAKGNWPEHPEEDLIAQNFMPVDWDRFGGLINEGLTSISQVLMRYLPESGISVGGEDRNKLGGWADNFMVSGQVVQMHFRSNTRGDYGFVQNQLYSIVSQMNSLPCHAVLHTALDSTTTDDGQVVGGPDIAGKKATAQCGAWFGDLLHAQDYMVPRKEKVPDAQTGETVEQVTYDTRVRYYFRPHPDPRTGIVYPAGSRCPPEAIAALEREYPGGYFEPTTAGGLDEYLKAIDRLSGEASKGDALKSWREKQDARLRGTAK